MTLGWDYPTLVYFSFITQKGVGLMRDDQDDPLTRSIRRIIKDIVTGIFIIFLILIIVVLAVIGP